MTEMSLRSQVKINRIYNSKQEMGDYYLGDEDNNNNNIDDYEDYNEDYNDNDNDNGGNDKNKVDKDIINNIMLRIKETIRVITITTITNP